MDRHIVTVALIVLFSLNAHAQLKPGRIYLPDNSIQVFRDGVQKNMAWCGGTNNPQVAVADLNHDGVRDLVIFDKSNNGLGVKTFINESKTPHNPKYVYNPWYAANFPPVVTYMRLEDYNRDGIPDLFHRGPEGIQVLRGYYNNSNQLCFKLMQFKGYSGIRYALPGSGMVNAYVSGTDIPAIGDVDNDGDIDFIAYDVPGGSLYYYRNCQEEDFLPRDSITLCVKDVCWGKSQQAIVREYRLNVSCGSIGTTCKLCGDENGNGAKTTTAGNSICLIDYDGDGDMDVLDGHVLYSDLQYLKNGKTEYGKTTDSMIAQDTMWGGKNGKIAYMPQFPMACWVDIDNDGDKDITVSPFADNTENFKCLLYYENTGSDRYPVFGYRMDTMFIKDMIDIGTGSAPLFYDYNKDGKADLFVGSDGYYQANGSLRTRVTYLENVSTAGNPKLEYRNNNFLLMDTMSLNGGAMAIGDLNGDGKDELIVGKTDGTMMIYKNSAASASVSPEWYQPSPLRDASSAVINVGGYATPCIYDLDNDGKKDLIIGCQSGKLYYYRNIGSFLSSANLQKITDTLGGIHIVEAGNLYTYSAPFIGRIDDQPKDYLVIGSKNGILYRYDGFTGGKLTGYNRLDSAYCEVQVLDRAVPAFTDIDGDGKYDMVVGNVLGGLSYYKQFFNVGVDDITSNAKDVKIYPNPAKDVINISWTTSFAAGQIQISLVSVTGQRVWEGTAQVSAAGAQINTASFPPGMYYCLVRSGSSQVALPVSVVK